MDLSLIQVKNLKDDHQWLLSGATPLIWYVEKHKDKKINFTNKIIIYVKFSCLFRDFEKRAEEISANINFIISVLV